MTSFHLWASTLLPVWFGFSVSCTKGCLDFSRQCLKFYKALSVE